jgi:hypothetical protein
MFLLQPKVGRETRFPGACLPSQLPNLNYFYTLPLLLKLIVRHANLHWDRSLSVYTDFVPQEFWIPLSRVSVSLSALGHENRRDTDRILRSILPEVRIRPGMTKQSSPSHWLRSWNNSKHSILIQVGEKTYVCNHPSIKNNNRYIPECGEHATYVAT